MLPGDSSPAEGDLDLLSASQTPSLHCRKSAFLFKEEALGSFGEGNRFWGSTNQKRILEESV